MDFHHHDVFIIFIVFIIVVLKTLIPEVTVDSPTILREFVSKNYKYCYRVVFTVWFLFRYVNCGRCSF